MRNITSHAPFVTMGAPSNKIGSPSCAMRLSVGAMIAAPKAMTATPRTYRTILIADLQRGAPPAADLPNRPATQPRSLGGAGDVEAEIDMACPVACDHASVSSTRRQRGGISGWPIRH